MSRTPRGPADYGFVVPATLRAIVFTSKDARQLNADEKRRLRNLVDKCKPTPKGHS